MTPPGPPPILSEVLRADPELALWLSRMMEYVDMLERRVTTLEVAQPMDFGAPVIYP